MYTVLQNMTAFDISVLEIVIHHYILATSIAFKFIIRMTNVVNITLRMIVSPQLGDSKVIHYSMFSVEKCVKIIRML